MHKALLTLSTLGLLFSGYLSGTKLVTGSCAFNEGCPEFLGYPACYFGFGMFTLLFIFSLLLVLKKMDTEITLSYMVGISGLGILFAGYFTLGELPILFREGLGAYVTGLPTCALGLIVYLIVFMVSLKARCPAQLQTERAESGEADTSSATSE